ncbi:hypothetical protein POM88_022430 [Heracleum sosnowskyi]|uniref:MATH domain-containing protein n=1 Tax=Heracleum sosnowskyi TaxID=360622 RepID=A0AAD8IF83_9APIA|nr:hypothetical protein POM88_022430 [Heracleum sosnowskyi]
MNSVCGIEQEPSDNDDDELVTHAQQLESGDINDDDLITLQENFVYDHNLSEGILSLKGILKYSITVNNFSRLSEDRLYSNHFLFSGYKWCVLIFPQGDNVDQLSIYLEVADSASLPDGWSRYAHFGITVVNQIQTKYSVQKESREETKYGCMTV